MLATVIIAAEPLLFWGCLAGDAQVHLVFMENASARRLYEFNRGESVSGETSPGYMMFGAAFFSMMPASAIPIVLKVAGLTAWYAFCWLVWRVGKRLLDGDSDSALSWPLVAAFLAATLSGSVYNANAGMENGIFAVVIWAWLGLTDRWGWFEGRAGTTSQEIGLASLLGSSFWLRPEGAVVAVAAFIFRLRQHRGAFRGLLPGALVVLTFLGAAIAFQYAFTGDLIATSILSRRILVLPRFIALGPISLDPTFAKRLLAYFPLLLFFLWGLKKPDIPVRSMERFLHLMLGLFFVLYTITGTPQLARYLIFLMPILVIGAVRGARVSCRNGRGRILVVLSALAVTVVNLVDLRLRLQSNRAQLQNATTAPARRQARTDQFLAALANPTRRPIVVATESVQLRYELDDRIVVRSLDGRVDRKLLGFVGQDALDHVGYLKARRVDFLLQTPSYNRNPSAWSLDELDHLEPGDMLRRDDLSFRRLPSKAFAIVTP